MKRWIVGLGVTGWLLCFTLVFCGAPAVDVEISVDSGGPEIVEADEPRPERPPEPVGAGQLSVVDANGKLVGVVMARTHRLLDDNELFDAVQVFHPGPELFFSIRMANAEILRPGKVFFAGGNCSGTAAVRALCPDCPSGFQLAFEYNGTWYRVAGGTERIQFKYSSYVAEEPGAQCTGHGNSSTHVYPIDPLGPAETPGDFTPPLKFIWGM